MKRSLIALAAVMALAAGVALALEHAASAPFAGEFSRYSYLLDGS
jgi:hypothetical protein